jgi:hypothetical protein
MEHKFTAKENLSLENSYGTLAQQNDVKLNVTVGIDDLKGQRGWYELYDIETGGEEWYAEGGLWFEGNVLTGYDGMFSLPQFILDKLKELGYDVTEMEESLRD